MKKIIRVVAIYGILTVVSVFANVVELRAQAPAASPAPTTPGPSQCTPENKLAWYTEFRLIFKSEQQSKAYDLAQKYLACPAEAGEENIRKYLKDTFIAVIDKSRRTPKVSEMVYDKKEYAKAFELGTRTQTEFEGIKKTETSCSAANHLGAQQSPYLSIQFCLCPRPKQFPARVGAYEWPGHATG